MPTRLDLLRSLVTPAPACSRCRWFLSEESECHRHAPAPNTSASDYRRRIFPVMQPTERCGDFEAR